MKISPSHFWFTLQEKTNDKILYLSLQKKTSSSSVWMHSCDHTVVLSARVNDKKFLFLFSFFHLPVRRKNRTRCTTAVTSRQIAIVFFGTSTITSFFSYSFLWYSLVRSDVQTKRKPWLYSTCVHKKKKNKIKGEIFDMIIWNKISKNSFHRLIGRFELLWSKFDLERFKFERSWYEER